MPRPARTGKRVIEAFILKDWWSGADFLSMVDSFDGCSVLNCVLLYDLSSSREDVRICIENQGP